MVENPNLGRFDGHDSTFPSFVHMGEPSQDTLPTQVDAQRPPVVIAPRRDSEQKFDFQPFNPSSVSQETFVTLRGEIQEFALKHLIKVGDIESIKRIRPDFEMDKPLSNYEIALTDAIEKVTRRENPITERLPNGITDPDIAFIITFAQVPDGPEGKGWKTDPELIRKLEGERLRRQGNMDLFYSHEWIGKKYAPARRYRWLLETQVKKEKEEERVAHLKNSDSTANQDVAEIRPELKLIKTDKVAA